MIVETYKINVSGMYGQGEAYDYNFWELECDHVIHVFELLLEQLNMTEDDSLLWFDGHKPGDPQTWSMASYNSTFKVVARRLTDEEIAEAESKDNE